MFNLRMQMYCSKNVFVHNFLYFVTLKPNNLREKEKGNKKNYIFIW